MSDDGPQDDELTYSEMVMRLPTYESRRMAEVQYAQSPAQLAGETLVKLQKKLRQGEAQLDIEAEHLLGFLTYAVEHLVNAVELNIRYDRLRRRIAYEKERQEESG
jgi:hypothetical protein